MEDYRKSVTKFHAVSVKDINDKLTSKTDFILFVGRETCPYCRRFVKKLDALVDEKGWKVDYINSENSEELSEIQTFRSTHNIPTVPGFMVQKDGNVKVVCDSSLPVEQIVSFVEE